MRTFKRTTTTDVYSHATARRVRRRGRLFEKLFIAATTAVHRLSQEEPPDIEPRPDPPEPLDEPFRKAATTVLNTHQGPSRLANFDSGSAFDDDSALANFDDDSDSDSDSD